MLAYFTVGVVIMTCPLVCLEPEPTLHCPSQEGSRVAANLLWDSTNRLVRAVRRERAWRNHIDLGGCAEHSSGWNTQGVPGVLADTDAGGVLAPIDAVLIEATRLNGISLADAAVLLGISYEAAKKRRQRAEATWVGWWAPELLPTLPFIVERQRERQAA